VREKRRRFRDQSVWTILFRMIRALGQPATTRTPKDVARGSEDTSMGSGSAPQTLGSRAISPVVVLLLAASLLVVVIVVSIVILVRLFSSSTPELLTTTSNGTPVVTAAVSNNTTPVPTQAKLIGNAISAEHVFGGGAAGTPLFVQPQEAVAGPGGTIYVADTGNKRVVVLNRAGKLLRSITSGFNGALQAPFSLAITPQGHLFVLDSDAGQIIEYDAKGTALRASNTALGIVHARGIAVDSAGHILVADPASNAVLTLNSDLTLLKQLSNATPGGAHLFDQPSAVAAGPGGVMYIVDSQNSRLERFSSGGLLQQTWQLAVSDTVHSPHVLPLADGRVLVSDPQGGKLLLFDSATNQVWSHSLIPGGPSLEPLGVALVGQSKALITCNGSGQILEIAIPRN